MHHTIANELITYPTAVSIGSSTPTKLVPTSGSKQYPSTLALRGNVSVLLSALLEEAEEGGWCGMSGELP